MLLVILLYFFNFDIGIFMRNWVRSPPNLLARASRMRSFSEHRCPPVIAGIKLNQMTSSIGCMKSTKGVIVHMKHVSFPLNSPAKADYVGCDSDLTVFDNNSIPLVHSYTGDFVNEVLNVSFPITAARCRFLPNVIFTSLHFNV